MSEDSFILAGAGDAIIMRKLRTFDHSRFSGVVDRIREADASVINLETLIHDYEHPPAPNSGGTYMRAPPWTLDELTWSGFNLFAAATNHSYDYLQGGMETTMKHLEDRNMAYAGLGRNLHDALEPTYIDTTAGRVALVAGCSTITEGSIAGEQNRNLKGRPGIAPLRYETKYIVPEEAYSQVQNISEALGLEKLKQQREDSSFSYVYPTDGEEFFELPNIDGQEIRFERGDEFRIERQIKSDDAKSLTAQIKRARRQADWVVASLHSHEFDDLVDKQQCADFVETFARQCIDAGADAFIGHGAHALQGIEIYDGAPIFYDLGNFVFQSQLVSRVPSDLYDRYGVDPDSPPVDLFDERVYDGNGEPKGFLANDIEWKSMLPICRFKDNTLETIEIYPLDLLQDKPRPQRGRPVLATGEKAEQILEDLSELSATYGTDIKVEDGTGYIRT